MAFKKEEFKLEEDNLKNCFETDKKVNFAFLPKNERAQIKNFLTNKTLEDTLHKQSRKQTCPVEYCNGSIMGVQNLHENRYLDQNILEAEDFINQYFTFNKKANTDEHKFRLEEVLKELVETKTINYTHDELMFGARTAWRNASRCIGRIQWNKLYLNDCRNIKSTKEMFEGVCKHIEYATNNGNLRSTITLFPQRIPFREDWLLWNSQLISFAGYQQEDGTVLGDPINVEFTNTCLKLGWNKPQIDRTQFDILPLIFSGPGEMPTLYEIPKELVLLVDIRHPTNPFLDDLNLKWYAVPAVSGMLFDVGGIQFPSAPFNGWYMGTEIAARDFLDASRYNLSRKFARRLNLDTSNSVNLWLDRVSLEMNIAVLHSFQSRNVTIVDHHTASESFIKHLETETKLRGGCPADWVWINPPMSSSLTKVFHQEMFNYHLKPSYEYQKPHSKTYNWKRQAIDLKYKLKSVAMTVLFSNLMQKITLRKRPTATILYATETGVSESFAIKLNKLLKSTFNCRVICMENYNLKELADEKILLFVTSTFGNGEAPDNGKSFWEYVSSLQVNDIDFSKLNYSVFALGSSQYSTFCEFGKNLDKTFLKLGAKQIVGVGLGDELKGQEKIFGKFSLILFKNICKEFDIEFVENNVQIENEVFNPGKVRLIETDNNDDEEPTYKKLRAIHNKPINSYNLISTTQLLPAESDHKVLLVKLTPNQKQAEEFTFDYKPGDHLAVVPANSEKLVNKILSNLKPDTVGMYQDDIQNTVYKIEVQSNGKWQPYTKIPECTLREALTNYFDISGPPSIKFLTSILNFIRDDLEKQNLAKIISDQKTYEDWKHCYCPNLGDLFDLFPSLKIGPKILFTQLNILQPRYYSISSTLDASPNEVHLTMTLVEFKTQDKKSVTKHGLCTNFFAENPKTPVNCFLRKVPSFHMPKSLDTPVILISAGSGIAPFRSFWMQSEFNQKNSSKGNKIFLFFGCRRTRIDNIFGSEFPSLLKKGVILDIFYAYSRDSQHKKRYVQDQVYKQKKLVHFLLEKENAHLYVCGDSKMANGVKHAVKKVLEEEGNLSDQDADTYLSKLFTDGRYHEDVFSSTHQVKKLIFK